MSESPFPSTDSGSQKDLYDDWKSHPVMIGGYRVDFDERTVTTPAGEVRNITPNSIKLLAFLLQHTNSYVSLQEVHDVIYGHQYKDDSSSRKQVTVLRKLFDDNDKEKKFIENRLGHGYRLIAPVEVIEVEQGPVDNLQSKKRSITLKIVYGFLVLLLGAFFSFYLSRERVGILSPDKAKSLTHLRGVESYPEFSKDGKWMLFDFQSQDKSTWRIHIREMESGELIPIGPESLSSRMPRWSLDDQYIVFSQFDDQKCEFISSKFDKSKKVVVEPRKIGDCSVFSLAGQAELWPDGKGMFYNSSESINAPFIIYSHSFGDSNSWPIAVPPPSGKGDYYFDVTEDGNRMVVLRNKNWSATEVWIYDTKSRETRLVDTVDIILFTVRWSEDESNIIYRNELNQVIKYNVKVNVKAVAYESNIPFDSPTLFNHGLVVRTGTTKNRDLEKINILNGSRELFESSSYRDILPALSRDGEQVAWVSNRSGLNQIWYKKTGERPQQITNIRNQINFEGLSFNRDGSKLGGTASGRWFIIDLDNYSITWSSADKYFTNFSWTRNSEKAYLLIKNVERSELVKLNIESLQLEHSGLPNDAFLALDAFNSNISYYSTLSKSGFWRVNKENGEEGIQYFDTGAVLNHTHMWSSISGGIYFISDGNLYFLADSSDEIMSIQGVTGILRFSAPNNGEWLLNMKVTPSDTDLKYFK